MACVAKELIGEQGEYRYYVDLIISEICFTMTLRVCHHCHSRI
jgi:hypothetical protein